MGKPLQSSASVAQGVLFLFLVFSSAAWLSRPHWQLLCTAPCCFLCLRRLLLRNVRNSRKKVKIYQKTQIFSQKCKDRLPSAQQQQKWRRRSACRVVDIYDAFVNPKKPRIFGCTTGRHTLLCNVIAVKLRNKKVGVFSLLKSLMQYTT